MTYGELFIGIVAYIVSIIIVAETIYKIVKEIHRKECEDCWKTKPLDFNREHAYEISVPLIFIISLVIVVIINVVNNWNKVI